MWRLQVEASTKVSPLLLNLLNFDTPVQVATFDYLCVFLDNTWTCVDHDENCILPSTPSLVCRFGGGWSHKALCELIISVEHIDVF